MGEESNESQAPDRATSVNYGDGNSNRVAGYGMENIQLGGTLTGGDMREARAVSDGSENKARDINIQTLNYGFIVSVGCHRFAIESHERLIEKLGQYYANPNQTEKEWFEKKTL